MPNRFDAHRDPLSAASVAVFCLALASACPWLASCTLEAFPKEGVPSAKRWGDAGTALASSGEAHDAGACPIACDPVAPQDPSEMRTACPPGFGCDPVRAGVLDCAPHEGGAALGEPCSAARECPTGATCNEGSCTPYCRADDDCARLGASVRCEALPDEDIQLPDVRVCVPDLASAANDERDGGAEPQGPVSKPARRECTAGAQRCDDVTPHHCTEDGVWEVEPIAAGRCGAECAPGERGCTGVDSRTCGPLGHWLPGAIIAGTCGATCNPGAQTCEGPVLHTCDVKGAWDAGLPSSACNPAGSAQECVPGEVGCGVGEDFAACPPGGTHCVTSSSSNEVYLSICDATGHWTKSYCSNLCTVVGVGPRHFCLVDGPSATGCYENGICP